MPTQHLVDGLKCGCLAYHIVPEDSLGGGWQGWDRGGCNWQQCQCDCHKPQSDDEGYPTGAPGHDACCQRNCGERTHCQGCQKPVLYRMAERIAVYGLAGSTEYWHSICWGLAVDENPAWQDSTYHECRTCDGDGMLDDVMPCGDCENGRVEA